MLLLTGLAEARAETPFPPTLELGTNQLQRIGSGELRKWLIKGCDIALYAEAGIARNDILSDRPRCLELRYTHAITARQFANGAWHSLNQSLSAEQLAPLEGRIAALHALYRDVQKHDRYRLYYLPGQGTHLELNGILLGTIPGADFAAAYFGVWLGIHPLSNKLRERLLEGATTNEGT